MTDIEAAKTKTTLQNELITVLNARIQELETADRYGSVSERSILSDLKLLILRKNNDAEIQDFAQRMIAASQKAAGDNAPSSITILNQSLKPDEKKLLGGLIRTHMGQVEMPVRSLSETDHRDLYNAALEQQGVFDERIRIPRRTLLKWTGLGAIIAGNPASPLFRSLNEGDGSPLPEKISPENPSHIGVVRDSHAANARKREAAKRLDEQSAIAETIGHPPPKDHKGNHITDDEKHITALQRIRHAKILDKNAEDALGEYLKSRDEYRFAAQHAKEKALIAGSRFLLGAMGALIAGFGITLLNSEDRERKETEKQLDAERAHFGTALLDVIHMRVKDMERLTSAIDSHTLG